MKQNQPKIVCIGGGTGTFVVLRGLKYYPYKLSAIVSMSDSGGSNKRIRDEFGLLPTSDLRQCLVALSEENGGVGLLRRLFMYRFEKGRGISGMTFGNLFMAALSDILGSQEEAIKQTGKVLRIHGMVIPVTFTKTNLYAEYEDGQVLEEEHLIDEPPHDGTLKITNIYLKPKARANPEATKALKEADLIILGPGDLYTSLLPNLLIADIAKSLKNARGKIVYVMNLMTKYGQTYNYSARDHLKVVERFIGKAINYIILNNGRLNETTLKVYAKYHESPVVNDLSENDYFKIIKADVANRGTFKKSKADTLVRSLIRHDSKKLAQTVVGIISSERKDSL